MDYLPQTKVADLMCRKFLGYVMMRILAGQASGGYSCVRPLPPYLRECIDDIRTYSSLLHRDKETRFSEVQRYFRCIDTERPEMFREARQAAEDHSELFKVGTKTGEQFPMWVSSSSVE